MSSVLVCSYWSVPLFLFFTQKTAYEMRISDWSSDVCASDLIAVALSDRSGADRAEIGARLRLGQVHRAGPPALDERRQIDAPLRVAAVSLEQLDGALGQQRAERKGHVGRVPHLLQRDRHRPGQTLAAMLRDRKSTRLNSS